MEILDIMREEAGPAVVGLFIFLLVFYILALIYSIVAYILGSLGIHSIAKRRGILHPWLAWLPFGCPWILGSISDQYQQIVKGKIRRRSVLLLVMSIVEVVVYFAIYVVTTYMAFMPFSSQDALAGTIILVVLVVWFVMFALIIVCAIFTYIALHDLYASCNPKHAITFLLLSIFLPTIMPIFIFANRKKDLGMTTMVEESCVRNHVYAAEVPAESCESE